ncbi:sortase A [Georgenia soli]|uniref:Sortase A n=1 Tax=Georgenia soli TaxID=638953 RepID=A0A2A9ERE2_9MICO|nr:class E sortase [Georgenia soli]PFG41156.1 sortase A [Georgenia soli]
MPATPTPRRGPHALIGVVAVVLGIAGVGVATAMGPDDVARVPAAVARPAADHARGEVPSGRTERPTESADPFSDVVVPPVPAEGTTFATMRVPRWGDYEEPVSEGITDAVLDELGLGRFPDSQMPGEEGNFALAGHRTLHSRPLYGVEELEVGDEIIVTGAEGEYTYAVTGHEIVEPDQVRVVEPDPQNPGGPAVGRLMTLVACHPLGSVAQRYVVYAELAAFEAA